MRNSGLWRILLGGLVLGAGSVAAVGQESQPRQIAAYFHWRALVAGTPDNPVCYVTHQAEGAVEAGRRAGPRPMLMVAWRPARASANVVTVFAAYRFKPGTEAILEFAPRISFNLYTTRDTAWAWSSEDDAAIVQAMRDGATVTVRGTSEADAAVADTFSLTGFTAATARAMRACRPR
ncbi:MAG: hypothetical protein KF889_00170 [Alphaproteobacteria bacterium]|nr:hypothetical protein [Alphaproteobacteria bacterium]MCW5743259.1 hypothetical protein [Alphaproteobacteria bacterium]